MARGVISSINAHHMQLVIFLSNLVCAKIILREDENLLDKKKANYGNTLLRVQLKLSYMLIHIWSHFFHTPYYPYLCLSHRLWSSDKFNGARGQPRQHHSFMAGSWWFTVCGGVYIGGYPATDQQEEEETGGLLQPYYHCPFDILHIGRQYWAFYSLHLPSIFWLWEWCSVIDCGSIHCTNWGSTYVAKQFCNTVLSQPPARSSLWPTWP